MLTPTNLFTTDQVFRTPWIDTRGIADLVIIVNTYPVEGLYINNRSLDVSTLRWRCSGLHTIYQQLVRIKSTILKSCFWAKLGDLFTKKVPKAFWGKSVLKHVLI